MNAPIPDALPATLALPAAMKDDGRVAPGMFWRGSQPFLDELADELRGQRVLEIFAGNGLLAANLALRGVEVTCTSLQSSHDAHHLGLYHPVIPMEAEQAAWALGADHDILLMSWPTVTPAALRACVAFGVGRPIAYIGEATDYAKNHLGGCADDEFFESLEARRPLASYRGNIMEVACIGRVRQPKPRSAPQRRF